MTQRLSENERSKRKRQANREAAQQPIDVRTVELEDEDGNPVVIAQQNVGPDNQVGEGDVKSPRPPKDPGEAAEEQSRLPSP